MPIVPVARPPRRTILRPLEISDRANDMVVAIWLGALLTSSSYVVAYVLGWDPVINWLEVFAVFTSYGSTYLCVRQRRFNYVFGAISTVAYSILFFQTGLLASAALNAYLAPALVYGWIRWRSDSDTRPVQHVALRWVPVYLFVTAIAYLGAVSLINILGGTLAFFDAAILALTILAQFLLDNKKIETWIVWALVNVAAIYVYFTSGLHLVGLQYIFFLLNTVAGYTIWRSSMKSGSLS